MPGLLCWWSQRAKQALENPLASPTLLWSHICPPGRHGHSPDAEFNECLFLKAWCQLIWGDIWVVQNQRAHQVPKGGNSDRIFFLPDVQLWPTGVPGVEVWQDRHSESSTPPPFLFLLKSVGPPLLPSIIARTYLTQGSRLSLRNPCSMNWDYWVLLVADCCDRDRELTLNTCRSRMWALCFAKGNCLCGPSFCSLQPMGIIGI